MDDSRARLRDLVRFYALLDRLEKKIHGARQLDDCSGRMEWPARGVYFFFENRENRSHSGEGLRIVRVGTHALKASSGTKLWTRLSQHRGQTNSGGGNHRGSIFRLIVGCALIKRDGMNCPTWGQGTSAKRDVIDAERHLSLRSVSHSADDVSLARRAGRRWARQLARIY